MRRITVALLAVFLVGCGAEATQGQAPGGGPESTSPSAPSSSAPPSSAPGSPAPSSSTPTSSPPVTVADSLRFTGRTVDGQEFDGAKLAGKPVVLWFWAPWCPKCRAQSAETARVATQFAGKASVVGIGGLDKTPKMRDFVDENKLSGFPQLTDENGTVWKKFEVVEQSTYVVLDRQGGVAYRGVLPNGAGLADKVRALVG